MNKEEESKIQFVIGFAIKRNTNEKYLPLSVKELLKIKSI